MPILPHFANQTELISIGKDLSVTGTEVSSPTQTDSVGDKVDTPLDSRQSFYRLNFIRGRGGLLGRA